MSTTPPPIPPTLRDLILDARAEKAQDEHNEAVKAAEAKAAREKATSDRFWMKLKKALGDETLDHFQSSNAIQNTQDLITLSFRLEDHPFLIVQDLEDEFALFYLQQSLARISFRDPKARQIFLLAVGNVLRIGA